MFRTWSTKLLALFIVGALPLTWAMAASTPVGRIALTVGEAKRIDTEGRVAPLRSGASVSEGDRIITGGDAVAIIVFVDEGRISLRSDSELLVKQYKVDPTGVNTRLDFELVRGSIRQISGQAARLQPERYRLNTPIASIGVRGTDFLAKTTSDTLETFIQEGKIVVLSGSASCYGASQTGSCAPLADIAATDTARYLKMVAGGKIERRIVASDEIERVFGISLVKASPPATSSTPTQLAAAPTPAVAAKAAEPTRPADTPSDKPPVTIAAIDSTGRDLPSVGIEGDKFHSTLPPKLNDIVALAPVPVAPPAVVTPPSTVVTPPAPPSTPAVTPPVIPSVPVDPSPVIPPVPVDPPVAVAPPPVVAPPSVPVVEPPVVVAIPTPPVVPEIPALVLHNTPDLSRQLVWGRFDTADKLPLQLLTSYEAAKAGRTVTVGDLDNFALWRNGPSQALSRNLNGEVQFAMHAGEAYLQQGSTYLPASISNPALSVNFDRSEFTTSLTLSQALTGDVPMQATGRMDDEGRFLAMAAGQRVAGAVSFDAKEAGYWFSRDHALGVFKGITLWNAR